MTRPIRIGVLLHPGNAPDFATWRSAVLHAEELGADLIFGWDHFHRPKVADLNQGIHLENASVVVMILTLQFIRPLYREQLIRSILSGMNQNGCLLLVEKVLGEDSFFNRTFIKYYYDFKKRNGYSEMEVSQKREALENVLIPYKLLENRELLLNEGFRYCDAFFKWYNFCGLVAVK